MKAIVWGLVSALLFASAGSAGVLKYSFEMELVEASFGTQWKSVSNPDPVVPGAFCEIGYCDARIDILDYPDLVRPEDYGWQPVISGAMKVKSGLRPGIDTSFGDKVTIFGFCLFCDAGDLLVDN